MRKILTYLKHPSLLLLILDKYLIIKLSDKYYLKLIYKKIINKNLNLSFPQTFNEKLQWLKLYNKKDIYTQMVDKYLVKDYVTGIIGSNYIIPTLGIYNNYDEIDFDKLPNQFVIKCTHDSGGLVVVDNKNTFDREKALNKIKKSLKNNYFYSGREWPYKNVKPRIIIEKYMGENLNDYKIFCFNGEPKFTLVCSNRCGNEKNTDFYDNDWNLLPFTRDNHVNNPNGIKKPKKLSEMLDIARKLSQNIPFVRIDLYDINNCIYFGEMTFFPSSGFEGFKPYEWDKKIGDMLDLSMVKKDEK